MSLSQSQIQQVADMITNDPDVILERRLTRIGRQSRSPKADEKQARARIAARRQERAKNKQAQAVQQIQQNQVNSDQVALLQDLLQPLIAGGGGMPITKRNRTILGRHIAYAVKQGYVQVLPVRTVVLTDKGKQLIASQSK